MIRRALRMVAILGLATQLVGCAVLLLGTGAAGGYALSRDSISNRFDRTADEVYLASREVVREMGFVLREDEQQRWIKGTVEGADVTVTVKPVSETSVELRVRARNKFLMPKVSVAQAVYNKIVNKL